MIKRGDLPNHPVSALDYLFQRGWIPRPVCVGQPLRSTGQEYALVLEVEGYGFEAVAGATKNEAKREAAEALLGRVLAMMCPHPTKMRYATDEVAYGTAERHQNIGKTGIRRAYLCRCGWWHMTSQPDNNVRSVS
jgi:hypothetical protein